MDNLYMQQAVDLAKKGRRKTYRNPLVGAIFVKDKQVIASGYHARYGDKHAERMAIDSCSTLEELKNSTLYVTLEPCTHFGKQPPCVDAVIVSGVSRVVIGQSDPNPVVSMKGTQKLREHGIQVDFNDLGQTVQALNPYYNYYFEHNLPYIVLKQAISLDGKITAQSGTRTQITGASVNQQVHDERNEFQAILVGSETVLVDNPTLLASGATNFPSIRVVLDRQGRCLNRPELNIFNSQAPTWIFTTKKTNQLLSSNVQLFENETWTIESVVSYLAKQGVQSVYVEGGAQIHNQFLAANLFNELITYVGSEVIGSGGIPSFSGNQANPTSQAMKLKSVQQFGNDVRIVSERVE